MSVSRHIPNEGCSTAKVWRGGAIMRDSACRQVHLGDVIVLCEKWCAILVLECVDVYRAVR